MKSTQMTVSIAPQLFINSPTVCICTTTSDTISNLMFSLVYYLFVLCCSSPFFVFFFCNGLIYLLCLIDLQVPVQRAMPICSECLGTEARNSDGVAEALSSCSQCKANVHLSCLNLKDFQLNAPIYRVTNQSTL